MKTAAPIDRLFHLKIVPLHADSLPIEIAIQLSPARCDISPGVVFRDCFGPCSHHSGIYGLCQVERKSGFRSTSASRSHFPRVEAAS